MQSQSSKQMDVVRSLSSPLSVLGFPDTPRAMWHFLALAQAGHSSSSLHCEPTPYSRSAITPRKPLGSLLCFPSQRSSAPHTPSAECLQGCPEGCFCTPLPPLLCFFPPWSVACCCCSLLLKGQGAWTMHFPPLWFKLI